MLLWVLDGPGVLWVVDGPGVLWVADGPGVLWVVDGPGVLSVVRVRFGVYRQYGDLSILGIYLKLTLTVCSPVSGRINQTFRYQGKY